MGDNGRLYQGFNRDYVEAMKDFCQQDDVIIPNLTEAALLTGSPYLEEGSYDMTIIENLLRDLSRLGPRKVVVIAILIFGARKGALVATVALGLFDIFNGYAAEVWITILESLIVCLVLYLVFEKLLKSNDKIVNVIIAGVIAALTKIILNFLKYTIINTIVASLPLKAAMLASVIKIGGTFGTSVVTIIAVPLLYPVFKRILKKDQRLSRRVLLFLFDFT